MSDQDTIDLKKLRLVVISLLIGFITVVGFLFRWQVIDAKRFDEMASERIRNEKIPALRGSIYAEDGSTLAYEERRFDIYAYLPEIERAEGFGKQTRQEYIDKVSEALGIEKTELEENLNSGPLWIKIASKLTQEEKEKVVNIKTDLSEEIQLAGNFTEFTSERIYPEDSLASQVIGFYGNNGSGELEGRSGLERYWEGSLKSIEGFQLQQVDSFENTIPIIDFTPIDEQRGSDIYLTIDVEVQQVLERRLRDAVERYGAASGSIVIMDPKDGAIKGIANYPTFNPNKYDEVEDNEAFSNRAATVPYEFGSVGKVFTIAGAIEEGVVEPNTMILPNGHSGCFFYRPKEDNDCKIDINFCRVCTYNKAPQGAMTVADSLVTSDNIALYHVAEKLKSQGLYNYLEKFRIGQTTGVELFESYGYLKEPEDWVLSDLVTFSYGHGYQATLLQVVSGVSAIANDGKIMQPYIVSKIEEADGTVKEFKPIAISQPVSEETADTVGNIMNRVYNNNLMSSYDRTLGDYMIGMKSGTALIPYRDRAGYSDEINATYVGFDLSEDKSFIMGVWLERPNGALASSSARPLWLDTFREVKDLLHVPNRYEQ